MNGIARRRVKILRGVPGAGKSTYSKNLAIEHFAYLHKNGLPKFFRVFSADDYFIGVNNKYSFDAKKLGKAHKACLNNFMAAMAVLPDSDEILVIDNTNTTLREITTYVDICLAKEVPFEIVTIAVPVEIAAHRNVHNVPVDKVYSMHRRLLEAKIPKEWPQIVVVGTI